MVTALLLALLGVGINIAMLTQAQKGFPRFAKTCQGCGCQAPPMPYPPAVHACPGCHWLENQNLSQSLRHHSSHAVSARADK
jgi:hypothetical protein